MEPQYVFFAFFALMVGNFAWRYFKSGSLTGAALGGRVTRDLGHVTVDSRAGTSTRVKVQRMEIDGDACVALVVVSKAFLTASMMPVKLTKAQAQELAALLQQASAN